MRPLIKYTLFTRNENIRRGSDTKCMSAGLHLITYVAYIITNLYNERIIALQKMWLHWNTGLGCSLVLVWLNRTISQGLAFYITANAWNKKCVERESVVFVLPKYSIHNSCSTRLENFNWSSDLQVKINNSTWNNSTHYKLQSKHKLLLFEK